MVFDNNTYENETFDWVEVDCDSPDKKEVKISFPEDDLLHLASLYDDDDVDDVISEEKKEKETDINSNLIHINNITAKVNEAKEQLQQLLNELKPTDDETSDDIATLLARRKALKSIHYKLLLLNENTFKLLFELDTIRGNDDVKVKRKALVRHIQELVETRIKQEADEVKKNLKKVEELVKSSENKESDSNKITDSSDENHSKMETESEDTTSNNQKEEEKEDESWKIGNKISLKYEQEKAYGTDAINLYIELPIVEQSDYKLEVLKDSNKLKVYGIKRSVSYDTIFGAIDTNAGWFEETFSFPKNINQKAIQATIHSHQANHQVILKVVLPFHQQKIVHHQKKKRRVRNFDPFFHHHHQPVRYAPRSHFMNDFFLW